MKYISILAEKVDLALPRFIERKHDKGRLCSFLAKKRTLVQVGQEVHAVRFGANCYARTVVSNTVQNVLDRVLLVS